LIDAGSRKRIVLTAISSTYQTNARQRAAVGFAGTRPSRCKPPQPRQRPAGDIKCPLRGGMQPGAEFQQRKKLRLHLRGPVGSGAIQLKDLTRFAVDRELGFELVDEIERRNRHVRGRGAIDGVILNLELTRHGATAGVQVGG
jgi:hypothetical protein